MNSLKTRLQVITQFLILFAAVGLCHVNAGATDTEFVNREIAYRDGKVWIEDTFDLDASTLWSNQDLSLIFTKADKSGNDIASNVASLLKADELKITQFDATNKGGRLKLNIISTPVFTEPSRVAKLRWVPFWAGVNISFPNGRSAEMKLHILNSGPNSIVWFPDLGKVDEALEVGLERYQKLFDFVLESESLQFSCRIRTRKGPLYLFRLDSQNADEDGITPAVVRQLHSVEPMTLNEMVSLLTDFRVGKPGYYRIVD